MTRISELFGRAQTGAMGHGADVVMALGGRVDMGGGRPHSGVRWFGAARASGVEAVLGGVAMTRLEAQEISDAIRAGRTFATRFQEEEWGLRYDRDGRFTKWSHRLLIEGGEESASETLTEEELIAYLMEWQRYDRIKPRLR